MDISLFKNTHINYSSSNIPDEVIYRVIDLFRKSGSSLVVDILDNEDMLLERAFDLFNNSKIFSNKFFKSCENHDAIIEFFKNEDVITFMSSINCYHIIRKFPIDVQFSLLSDTELMSRFNKEVVDSSIFNLSELVNNSDRFNEFVNTFLTRDYLLSLSYYRFFTYVKAIKNKKNNTIKINDDLLMEYARSDSYSRLVDIKLSLFLELFDDKNNFWNDFKDYESLKRLYTQDGLSTFISCLIKEDRKDLINLIALNEKLPDSLDKEDIESLKSINRFIYLRYNFNALDDYFNSIRSKPSPDLFKYCIDFIPARRMIKILSRLTLDEIREYVNAKAISYEQLLMLFHYISKDNNSSKVFYLRELCNELGLKNGYITQEFQSVMDVKKEKRKLAARALKDLFELRESNYYEIFSMSINEIDLDEAVFKYILGKDIVDDVKSKCSDRGEITRTLFGIYLDELNKKLSSNSKLKLGSSYFKLYFSLLLRYTSEIKFDKRVSVYVRRLIEPVNGCFFPGSNSVCLNNMSVEDSLEDCLDVYDTCFHEFRHALQDETIKEKRYDYVCLKWAKDNLLSSLIDEYYDEKFNYRVTAGAADARIYGFIEAYQYLRKYNQELADEYFQKKYEDYLKDCQIINQIERTDIRNSKPISLNELFDIMYSPDKLAPLLKDNPILLYEYNEGGYKRSDDELLRTALRENPIIRLQIVDQLTMDDLLNILEEYIKTSETYDVAMQERYYKICTFYANLLHDRPKSNNQLENIEIPCNITQINSYAFSGNKLKNIEIPESVTNIGSYAFRSNELTSVVIPKNVLRIEEGAFTRNNITELVIEEGVRSIGDYVFRYNKITDVIIPKSVSSVGSYAFSSDDSVYVTIKGKTSKDDFKSFDFSISAKNITFEN